MNAPGTLRQALRLDLRLQHRYGFFYAAVFSSLLWEILLLLLPEAMHPMALPYLIFGDLVLIGFFVIAGAVFFERGERTLFALLVTPMRFRDYLTSKVAILTALSLVMALVIAVSGVGFALKPVSLVAGVVICGVVFLLCSFISATPFSGIAEWIIPSTVVLAVLNVPLLSYSGLWDSYIPYLIPSQAGLLLLGDAFGRVTLDTWQVGYVIAYPTLCVALLGRLAHKMFLKHLVASQGGE